MATLLEIRNLKKYFQTPKGVLHAVDGISFSLEPGKTMGIVGESGCGKSTLGRTVIRLIDSSGGQIIFENKDVTFVRGRELKALRQKMQIIFQDPFASLNPRFTVERTIREALMLTKRYSRPEAMDETERLMELVGIDQRLRNSYPHELDGGRRQRVVIARALATGPRFVVGDEPVSALDVSIQAQIINLLQDLQEAMDLTYIFITHDLSAVKHISDVIGVMYLGQMVEICPSNEIFRSPLHPYTKALLSAIPSIDIHHQQESVILEGEIVSPINPKPGCRFSARCRYSQAKCGEPQSLEEIATDHFVFCSRAREIND
ncbi:MAG: ABC transporter ATP-binding protein [Clostridiales Family XIII bacterium]|jgi:peptide/nickel transport system ATP-binding protein|nr:ABC transporter ATP-binding protein [Clostridiales Family XIII bacterium]